MRLRAVDLFSGIGGIRLGVEQACKAAGVEHECVWASEILKNSIKVYRKNFPEGPNPANDITHFVSEEFGVSAEIPEFDMCLAGFPCQSFAQCGKRLGFKDKTRGTLIFRVLQLIEARNPSCILLENVEGLLNHGGGETLRTIMGALAELGYRAEYKLLNSRNFGVPHNRPRVYIVGFKDPTAMNSFSWPEPTDSSKTLEDILEPAPVPAKYYLSQQYVNTLKAHRARHEAQGHGFGYEVRPRHGVANCLVLGGMGHERNLIQDRESLKAPVRLDNRKTPTNDDFLRRMTPLEWERLQGYPDGFTDCISDTARWDALGNTVTVPVIKSIAAQMIQAMQNPSEDSDSFFDDIDLMDDTTSCTEEDRAEEKDNEENKTSHEQVSQGNMSHLRES